MRNKSMSRRKLNTIFLFAIAGLYSFISVGYAALQQDLMISGEVSYLYNSKRLYDVLKRAAEEGTYAREYTGAHQDSMAGVGSKKIYHWYGSNATNGTAIQDKFNVVFAGQCWQMIRTTDTGGVKLLYNGEPTITGSGDNIQYDCGTSRPGKIGVVKSTTSLSGSYYYGDGYTTSVSGNTTTFTLTNPVQVTVNSSNASTIIPDIVSNYPYTCKKTTADGTCTNTSFYKVDSQSSSYNAYVYLSTGRDSIGQSVFNSNYNSVGDVGYMYNTRYPVESTTISGSNTMLSSVTLSSSTLTTYGNYYFGDNYTLSGNNHALTNPVKGNTITDYPASWVGKYMCQSSSSSSCSTVYYIGAIDTSGTDPIIYRTDIASGREYNDAAYKYLFGDSIVDQGDGTFEVKNNIQEVVKRDWNTEYSTKVGKYVCMPGYYTYDSVNNKYICSDGGSQKVGALKYITATTITNFTATSIYKYGFGIESYNSSYKLVSNNNEEGTLEYIYNWPNTSNTNCFTNQGDTISNCGYNSLSKSHYTCYNLSGVCDNYYYINSTTNTYTYSTSITGGKYVSMDLTDPNNILYEMLYKSDVNTTDSTIKTNIDLWYQNTLLADYDTYIDDTIYCNNRKIREVSGVKQFGGWNPNGGTTDTNYELQFNEYNVTNDLSCPNITDRFSVSNASAQLTYKVGLMTSPEMNLLNNSNARVSSQYYWLASPNYFSYYKAFSLFVNASGNVSSNVVSYTYGVRPSVSLTPGTKYSSGTGSMADPYIVSDYISNTSFSDGAISNGTRNVTITFPSGCGNGLTCSYTKDGGSSVNVTSTSVVVPFTSAGYLNTTVSDSEATLTNSHLVRFNALYVSSSGNDTTGNGSIATPYKTLTKAYDMTDDTATIYMMSNLTTTSTTTFDRTKNITLTSCTKSGSTCTYSSNYSLIRGSSFTDGYVLNQDHGTLNLSNVTVNGNNVSATSGLIYTYSMTVGAGATITNGKRTSGSGGGITVGDSGSLTVNGGTISNNSSSDYGGGIYGSTASTITLSGGTISGNSSSKGGGIFSAATSTTTISGATITGNSATDVSSGAGVYALGSLSMTSGSVTSNTATGSGGGIFAASTFNMSGGSINNNTSGGIGAGVNATFSAASNVACQMTMSGGEIKNNESTDNSGGGIFLNGDDGYTSNLTMTGGTISGNVSSGVGGGIRVSQYGTATVTGGTITSNTGNSGGAIHNAGSLTIGGTMNISNNTATAASSGSSIFSKNISSLGTFTDQKASYTATNNTQTNNKVVTAVGTSYALDVTGGVAANGTNVQLYSYSGAAAQKWHILPDAAFNGIVYYHFESQINKTQLMDNTGNASVSGTNVQTYEWGTGNRLRWSLTSAGSGYYYIKSYTGLCLDLAGGSTGNGKNIQVYTCNNTNAQKWKFVAV